MKQCRRCKEWKFAKNFANYKKAPDGLQYWCRQCQTEYSRTTQRKESISLYAQSKQGKINRNKRQKNFLKTEKGKLYRSNKSKRHRARDIVGEQARHATNKAVKDGIIPRISTQKCQECGNQARHYHHWSYEKEHWLDVIPLCFYCHIEVHS